MKDKLITIAIRRPEQAEQLKANLEHNGIAASLEVVDEKQKQISDGMRVRINEGDLTKALAVIDRWERNVTSIGVPSADNRRVILAPVDFSDYSIRACETACMLAVRFDADVVLLHAYTAPTYYFTIGASATAATEAARMQMVQINADVANLTNLLTRKVERGELPRVQFSQVVREGIPEDVIIETAESLHPQLVVMGTRGKDKKEEDLIGSVTAEVIEHCMAPVLAIPESCSINTTAMQNVLFATNFDEKTLLALDRMMEILKYFSVKINFAHFASHQDAWNEVMLSGIKSYFQKKFPNIETNYSVISGNDELLAFDRFIADQKIDMIMLNTHKRSFIARLFNPSIARKMVFHARTSVLVFHT